MADIVLLERTHDSSDMIYRGLERTRPPYISALSEDSDVNQAFFWYSEAGGESGIIHDLAKAREIISLYAQLSPPIDLDLIEITRGSSSHPEIGSELLGHDLCAGFHLSLISSGLLIPPSSQDADLALYVHSATAALVSLVKAHFSVRLNQYGLFSDYGTAEFCLECMKALQEFEPNLWESDNILSEVVVLGLWKAPLDV